MCFSSGVYLYFRILMYVKRHEQFEIGCGAIFNKIYEYYYVSSLVEKLLCHSVAWLKLPVANTIVTPIICCYF